MSDPPPSRSVQRRIAAMKGEPAPTFETQAPLTSLNLNEEEIYRRVMMRIEALMKSDPDLGSRDGIELDHLTAAVELYERIKWPMGRPVETVTEHRKWPGEPPHCPTCGCGLAEKTDEDRP